MCHSAGRSLSSLVRRWLVLVAGPVAAALCSSPSTSAQVVGTYALQTARRPFSLQFLLALSGGALTTHAPAPASSPSPTHHLTEGGLS